MASFAQQAGRTCEESGHHCALKSLQDLRLITQEQYNCLINLPGFCVPGIGTNPSKILRLLNGETFGCDDNRKSVIQKLGINFGTPMDSDSADRVPENLLIRFDLSRMIIPVGMGIPEIIHKTLNDKILKPDASRLASRLVLHLEGGTKGHYFVFRNDKDNPYLIDPFDKNRESFFRSTTKISFKQLSISNPDQILFFVNTSELSDESAIVSKDKVMFEFYDRGIDILDTKACEELETYIMENLTEEERACIENGAAGYLPDKSSEKRKRGGKTNTKKKYRAKTTISTNKYAKRHRIRRSRRKSQGNRINNGKH
jgi:hypothetical protein